MEKPMTQKEVTEILRNSDFKDWLNGIEIRIQFPHLDYTVDKKGVQAIHQYFAKEARAWNKINEELKSHLLDSKYFWNKLLSGIEDFINAIEMQNLQILKSKWQNVSRDTSSLSNNTSYFTIDSDVTKYLISLQKEDVEIYHGAYKFFTKTNGRYEFNGKKDFAGAILAYEFLYEDRTKIPSRRRALRSSLNKFKNDFESFNNEVLESKQSFIEEIDKKFEAITQNFTESLENKNEEFSSWFEKEKTKKQSFDEETKKKVEDLENLYGEKLMLSKPAEYWIERAKTLREDGKKWLNRLLWTSGISVTCLVTILISINNNTIENVFTNTGSAIRWSLVFLVIVSLLVYAIRTFAKLTFSTFHLVRDAEERKQLVYVYLSLKEEKQVSTEERQLILQAIFSRSDSGLLREDSSPTMPGAGAAIEKLMGK